MTAVGLPRPSFAPNPVASTPVGSTESEADLLELPGVVEQALVVVACFVLLNGLPVDWFVQTDIVGQESTLNRVEIQLLVMGACTLRIIGNLDWLLRIIRVDAALFLFAALHFVSTFWSANPVETAKRAAVFLAVTLFAAYLVLRFPLAQILELWAIMFSITAIINVAFVVYWPEYGITADRWDGIYPQKNALGFAALIAIPTLLIAGRGAPKLRFLYYASAAAYGALLLGSQSKTMLLATVGSLGLMQVYRVFRGRRTMPGVVYLSLLLSLTFTLILTFRNLEAITEFLDRDVTFTGRVPLWDYLLPIAAERPILGYGFKAVFDGYFSPVHELWVAENWEPAHAHNALLQTWLELGAVGAAIFLWVFLRGVRRAVRAVDLLPGAVGIWPLVFLTSALLVSITEPGMSYELSGWLMYAVALLAAGSSIDAA